MPQPGTIAETFDAFNDYLIASRSAHTARAYGFAVRLFANHLRKLGVDMTGPPTLLDSRTFELFPPYLLRLGYQKRSMVTYLAGFERYRRWLIRERLIAAPDAFEIEALSDILGEVRSKRHARLTRLPKIDDAARIIQAARDIEQPSPRKERDLAMALFLFTSGVRAFECANLRCKDIDLTSLTGSVIGKGDLEGVIYFTQETADAIRHYWQVRGGSGPGDPVFARHDKGAGKKKLKPLSSKTVWNIIDQLRELAGIEKGKFSPHWMRHAAAMEIQRTGHDVIRTAKFLRHHGLSSVHVYADATDEEMSALHRETFGGK